MPTPARPFVTIQLEVLEDEDPTELIVDAIAEADIDAAVVRIIYSLPPEASTPVDLERVRQALDPAFYIAGILPQASPKTRLRRSGITEELSLKDALDRYIDNLPELRGHRDVLQRYAGQLEGELELSQIEEDEN